MLVICVYGFRGTSYSEAHLLGPASVQEDYGVKPVRRPKVAALAMKCATNNQFPVVPSSMFSRGISI